MPQLSDDVMQQLNDNMERRLVDMERAQIMAEPFRINNTAFSPSQLWLDEAGNPDTVEVPDVERVTTLASTYYDLVDIQLRDAPRSRQPQAVEADLYTYEQIRANHMSLDDMYWPSAEARNAAYKDYLKAEVGMFEEFMATGMSDVLRLRVTPNRYLVVYGEAMGADALICIVTPRLIKADRARSKHLKKLLGASAKREGLRLEIIDDLPSPEGRKREVAYWKWKVREEVDDSELVRQTPLKPPNTATSTTSVSDRVRIDWEDTPF